MSYPYRYTNGAEVLGQSASAIFNNIRRDDVIESLKKHGVAQLEPDQWYPVDKFVDVMAEWYQNSSTTDNLVSVGMAIIENAPLPPEVNQQSPIEQLSLISMIHDQSHRNGDVGKHIIEQVNSEHIKITSNTPYPDDMIYGYIYGICKRFLVPNGYRFTLKYDDAKQHNGDKYTIYHITLKKTD